MWRSLPEILDVVVCWAESLQGRGELSDALRSVVEIVGAKHARLVRVDVGTTGETVLVSLDQARGAPPPRQAEMSFSRYLLGDGIGKARSGTVWYLTEFRHLSEHQASAVRLGMTDARTRELAAIVLEPRTRDIDILELRFTDTLPAKQVEAISVLMPVLARAWQNRRGDFFAVGDRKREADSTPAGRGVTWTLGSSNPAGFTKAEYRVCALLSRGLGAKAISARLRISESTVRSHLRSIYAKTNTQGQRELMSQLFWSGVMGDDVEPKPVPKARAEAGGQRTPARQASLVKSPRPTPT